MVNAPDASGSGNPLTPLARMPSANFTAFSCVAAVLSPVPADPFPQPATITAIMARAASGQSVLLMVSPRILVICVGNGSLPCVLVTAASLDRSRVGVSGRAAVVDGLGAQLALAGFIAVDLAQPDDW